MRAFAGPAMLPWRADAPEAPEAPEARHDWARTRPLTGRVAFVVAIGTLAGFAATTLVLDRRFDPGEVRLGAWTTWPKSGTVDIDPYARAIFARTGEVPPPAAEALVYTARADDEGRRLDRRCSYRVSDPLPSARFWSVAVVSDAGAVLENAAQRYGFSSAGVVRQLDGSFTLEISPRARPGNWLPVSGTGSFLIVLRLYDSLLGATTPFNASARFPAITRQDCSS